MSLTEFIRLEVGGNPPQALICVPWGGIEPTRSEFLTYAKEELQSFYEPNSFEPKQSYGILRGGQPVPEGVRYVDSERSERWRYTLYDLRNDRKRAETP
jgi:hypothetical protein